MPCLLRFISGPVCLTGAGALLYLVLGGCASPDPQPFQEFSQATTGVGTATDKALRASIAQSRDGLIDSIQDLQSFNGLKMYFRAEPGSYTWGNQPDGSWKDVSPALMVKKTQEAQSSPSPALSGPNPAQWINYYYKPQRLTSEIESFNKALTQYSSLLTGLAGKELISGDDFKKMATALNAQAYKIGKQAGISAPRDTALFSTGAIVLFEEYLKSRQRSVLRKAITENTAQIKQFSGLGVQLTYLLSVPVQRSYNQSFDALQKQFESAKSEGGRRKAVQSAVVLNDSMIERWELFTRMDSIYQNLPEAHQELARAVEGKGGTERLLELSQSAGQLIKIYESLKESNEKAARADARKEKEDSP